MILQLPQLDNFESNILCGSRAFVYCVVMCCQLAASCDKCAHLQACHTPPLPLLSKQRRPSSGCSASQVAAHMHSPPHRLSLSGSGCSTAQCSAAVSASSGSRNWLHASTLRLGITPPASSQSQPARGGASGSSSGDAPASSPRWRSARAGCSPNSSHAGSSGDGPRPCASINASPYAPYEGRQHCRWHAFAGRAVPLGAYQNMA